MLLVDELICSNQTIIHVYMNIYIYIYTHIYMYARMYVCLYVTPAVGSEAGAVWQRALEAMDQPLPEGNVI